MAVIGELALGVAGSFVYEMLRRPLQILTNEIHRRDAVNKALTDRHTPRMIQTEKSQLAISDLSRIIGNSHGQLTENVAVFFRELQKTAIPETLASAALCGSDPESVFPAFESFYNRFDNLDFTSRQIFDAIFVACSERVNSVSDKELLAIVRAQHHELIRHVTHISQALSHGNLSEPLTYNELREARLKVARSIEAINRYTNVETLQGTKKFRLKSLAISGRLARLSDAEIGAAKMSPHGSTVNYITFRRNFDRTVILGDPGGGKSTLTQLLCYDLANLTILEEANPGRKDYDARDQKIPLKIVLRAFEAKFENAPSYTFFDMMRDEVKIALENDEILTSRYLQTILSSGEAMVIFDGLDEILDVGQRRSIVSLIEQFSAIYAACPVLVTSRLVGYRDAPLSQEFEPHGLARFSEDEIKKYCTKAIKAVSGETLKVSQLQGIDFLKQTSKIGNDIRENPLMLGLMVQIFVYRGDVPSNRPEVYKECATLMFEKWDGRRDIVVENVPRDDMELLDVFGYVASRTFGDANSEEGVSKDWLIAELRTHFGNWYIDKASAHRAAKSLVDFLTGRAWVMSEVGSGIFKFTHRTFLEYFFARHLISESVAMADLIVDKLSPRILRNEWVVISHLALHMAIFRDGGKARQAGQAIVALLAEGQIYPANQELPLLEFVAAALDYLVIPEALYLDIVERLLDRVVTLGAREAPASVSVVWTIFQTTRNRLELAKKACENVFERHMVGDASPEMLFCVYVLGLKHRATRHDGRPFIRPSRPQGLLWRSLDTLRLRYRLFLEELASTDLSVAKTFAFAYDDKRLDLYRIHGVAFLETSISPLVPMGVDQILSSCLEQLGASMFTFSTEGNLQEGQLGDCGELVRAVADDAIDGLLPKLNAPLIEAGRADRIADELEAAIRYIWRISENKKRSAHARNSIAQILVGVSLISESLKNASHHAYGSQSKGPELPAPHNVIENMIRKTGDTRYRDYLLNWIAEYETGSER
ncbi:hypothetical protein [Agrobacterium sp.]|uniref:NACHT domain-containing protein n=1 Tax=Agrobacterium sp. TaxID=361 RepID=UPI002897C03F|nr:hypothetical protein [Agrobacterium sp.]